MNAHAFVDRRERGREGRRGEERCLMLPWLPPWLLDSTKVMISNMQEKKDEQDTTKKSSFPCCCAEEGQVRTRNNAMRRRREEN